MKSLFTLLAIVAVTAIVSPLRASDPTGKLTQLLNVIDDRYLLTNEMYLGIFGDIPYFEGRESGFDEIASRLEEAIASSAPYTLEDIQSHLSVALTDYDVINAGINGPYLTGTIDGYSIVLDWIHIEL